MAKKKKITYYVIFFFTNILINYFHFGFEDQI